MTYFTFEGTAPQNQSMKQLKTSLQVAYEHAQRIENQLAEMTDDQAIEQFGKPAVGVLTIAQMQTTISDIVTALEATGVTNFINRVGFNTQ